VEGSEKILPATKMILLFARKWLRKKNLGSRVWLFPNIPEQQKKTLLNAADLVVSPNIKVPGTMEGFGINVVEAAVCGRMVAASALEGLKDAVKENENGFWLNAEMPTPGRGKSRNFWRMTNSEKNLEKKRKNIRSIISVGIK